MSGDDGDDDGSLEELRERSSFGDRDTDNDPYREQREEAKDVDPIEEVIDQLVAIREGGETPSIGCRDDSFAAWLDYLKDHPEEMRAVCEELESHLEYPPDVDHDKKAGVLRLLLRVGAQTGAPDQYELIQDASAEYGRRKP